MDLEVYSPSEWDQLSEVALKASFGISRPASMNRYDFAVLSVDGGVPQAFMMCREVDSESCYMSFGGGFPPVQGTTKVVRIHREYLDFLKSRYKRANTLIKNDNKSMIKLAIANDMKIIGTRTLDNETYVEFLKEF